jgi:putative SOS response-associated peptidase YedK
MDIHSPSKNGNSLKNSVDKRCLVISNGYSEWQCLDPKGKAKQKYELCLTNEELFSFAGYIAMGK